MSYAMDHREAKGTALYARKMIESFLASAPDDFEIVLIHYEKTNDPLYDRAREIIMPRIRLPYGSHFASQLLFFLSSKERFDILHWFQARLYPFYFLAPAKRIIVTAHGAGQITAKQEFFDFSKEVFNLVISRWNRWIDIVIASSDSGRQEIITHYHIAPERTEVIYHGVDTGFHTIDKQEARQRVRTYGIEGAYILDVSRMQPHKNVGSLVKAYIEMREKHPERTEELVIVGKKLPGSERIIEEAHSSPFSKDIHFVEFVPDADLNSFYSGAEAFVFPSLVEGFGLPVVEAMAAGVPVITSNTSSLPEVAGNAAILVDPLNIADLRDAMQQLLSDKPRQEDLRARGIARAKRFTWQKTAEETLNLYRRLVQR